MKHGGEVRSTTLCMNILDVGRLVVVIDVNPSHGFWTKILMKLFGHEGK
jgi:predicted methyltransferase